MRFSADSGYATPALLGSFPATDVDARPTALARAAEGTI